MGREDEQRTLDALISGARVGRSGVLVLSGEAGIGKTALLGHAAEAADGFRILRGVGTGAEKDLAFAGLARVLLPLADAVDDLPGPQAHALGVALALRSGGRVDRFAVSAATLTLLTRAAESRPLAVIVDDAHLLDTPSAQALAFVARRILVDAMVCLAAVRPGESDAWSGLPTLPLGPLSPEAAEHLADDIAASPLTAEQRHWVSEVGAGNPLAIRSLAQDPARLTSTPLGQTVAVPQLVADALSRRTAGLDADELKVLRVVAVSDGDLPTVVSMCDDLGLSIDRLRAAEDLRIVTLSPYRVEFTHPLVASVLYSGIPAGERRQLHTLAAEAMPVGEVDRRAWHRSEAVLGLDDDVAQALEDVGERASARGAFAVASSAHERAATLTSDATARARRFLAAGEAAWLAGEDQRAPALLGEAIRNAPDAVQRARARATAGHVAARRGSLHEARGLLVSAAKEVEIDAPNEALLMYAGAVEWCLYDLDARGAVQTADQLERLAARTGGDPSRREAGVAAIAVGMARAIAGEPGAESLRRGVDTLARRPKGPSDEADWALLGLLYLREAGAARELLRETIETRRQNSELGHLPHLLFHLARHDATTSRWTRAESGYSEAVDLAREFGQATELGANLAGLTQLLSRQGRIEDCRRRAAEAADAWAGRNLHLVQVWTGFALAELDLCLGDVEAAVAGFSALDTLLDHLDASDPDLSPGPELVEALLRLGDPDRAQAVNTQFQERALRSGRPWSLARAARATALLGSDDDLDHLFAEAMAWHDRGDDPFERARTLMLHGSRLRRARRRIDARVRLEEARVAFDQLGARRWSDAVSAELEATGLRARARQAGPVLDLTPRERQIAELLAEGRTTREAAAALFLSPKTVEYHLRHVYTKLDITSRDELRHRLPEL